MNRIRSEYIRQLLRIPVWCCLYFFKQFIQKSVLGKILLLRLLFLHQSIVSSQNFQLLLYLQTKKKLYYRQKFKKILCKNTSFSSYTNSLIIFYPTSLPGLYTCTLILYLVLPSTILSYSTSLGSHNSTLCPSASRM